MKPIMNDMRIIKGEKTRANILQATIAIIAEKGLKDISTAKLAKAIGVSKSTIFHHFNTSDELLASTLNQVFEELLQAINTEEYRDVEHFLQSIGQSIFQLPEEKQALFKVFMSFSHEAMYNSAYREVIVAYGEQVTDFFRTQLTDLTPNSINPETIDSVSKLLIAMMDGIGLHYLLTNDSEKYQKLWDLQTKSIIQLLDIYN